MNDKFVWMYNIELQGNDKNYERLYFSFVTDCEDPRDGLARILSYGDVQAYFAKGYTLKNFSGPNFQGLRYLPGGHGAK